jgi:hypothetical protein
VTDTPPADQSDQRPEEAPPEVVPRDDAEPGPEETRENPGVPGENETSTGNPENAGAEE